jgi:hypothetical protein
MSILKAASGELPGRGKISFKYSEDSIAEYKSSNLFPFKNI